MIEKIYDEFDKFKTPFIIDRNDDGMLVIIESGFPPVLLMDFLKDCTEDKTAFGEFIAFYNKTFTQKNGQPGTKKGDSKTKRQFNARIKEGFTMNDFKNAILALHKDDWHKKGGETNIPYYYATPEYITRADKLNKFRDLNKDDNKNKMVF